MNKKNLKKAGVGLIVSALVVGGASAFLSTTKTAGKTNNITVGQFKVIFENQQNAIILKDSYPMNKNWAETHLQSYSFNIANKSGLKVKYKLSAHVDEGAINPSLVKLSLYRNGAPEAYLFSIPEFNDKMAHFVAKADSSDAYTLYAYIDETATNEVTSQSIKFHLEVNAEQIEDNVLTVNYVDEENVVVKTSNIVANLGETISPVLPEGYVRVDDSAITVQQENIDGTPINIKVKKGEVGPVLPQDARLNINYIDGQAWKVGAQTLSVEADIQELPSSRLSVPQHYRLASADSLAVQQENLEGTPIDVPVVKDEEPPKKVETDLGFGSYDRIVNATNGYGQSITMFIKADILSSYRYNDIRDLMRASGFSESVYDDGSTFQGQHYMYTNYSARIDSYNDGHVGTELTIVRNNSFAGHRPVEDTYPLTKAIGQALGITHYDYFYPNGGDISNPHPVMITNSVPNVQAGDRMLNVARKLYKLGFAPEGIKNNTYISTESYVGSDKDGNKISIYNQKGNYKIQIDMKKGSGNVVPEYISPNNIYVGTDVLINSVPTEAKRVGEILGITQYDTVSNSASNYQVVIEGANFEDLKLKAKEAGYLEEDWSPSGSFWSKKGLCSLQLTNNGSSVSVDLTISAEDVLR